MAWKRDKKKWKANVTHYDGGYKSNNVTASNTERKRDKAKKVVKDSARIIAEEKLIFCVTVILMMLFFGDKIK